MKRDHQKISTCAIKGCKILVGKAVRKNASHIKEKKICSTPILFYYKSSKAIMVGLLGQSWESLRLIKPVAESMVYISIFPASCNATRRNSPLGWTLKWRGLGPPTYCTCTRSKEPSGRISKTTIAPLFLLAKKNVTCNHIHNCNEYSVKAEKIATKKLIFLSCHAFRYHWSRVLIN